MRASPRRCTMAGWSKEFLEAGKRRLAGDTAARRDFRRGEGSSSRSAQALKEVVADLTLGKNRLPQKKHDRGWGETRHEIFSDPTRREIIRLVEQLTLDFAGSANARQARRSQIVSSTAGMIGISAADQEALADRPSRPDRGSGTVSQRLSAARLSPWRWISRNSSSAGTGGALHGWRQNILVSEASVLSAAESARSYSPARPTSSSKRPRSSRTRPRLPNQLWQTDSHLSQDHGAGVGAISPPCWTTSRASLSPGSSVRP